MSQEIHQEIRQEIREKIRKKLNPFARAILEMLFIIFLFYANLLMGEFTRNSQGYDEGLLWALKHVVTVENLIIAIIAAFIGYFVFEFFRQRL